MTPRSRVLATLAAKARSVASAVGAQAIWMWSARYRAINWFRLTP